MKIARLTIQNTLQTTLCLSRVRATPKKANDLDQAGDDVEQLIMNSSEELQPANWQIELDDYEVWFNERDMALDEFRICKVVDEWAIVSILLQCPMGRCCNSILYWYWYTYTTSTHSYALVLGSWMCVYRTYVHVRAGTTCTYSSVCTI